MNTLDEAYIKIRVRKYEDHVIHCPKCQMIIEFSGVFEKLEIFNCPWCSIPIKIERKYHK